MSSDDWLALNGDLLGSRYEKLFVKNVLELVPGFDFDSLKAQMPFTDLEGKQRYCDFSIIEGVDIKIAVEVDGYDKRGTGTGMSHEDFVDWQRRQAALASQGWFVLRFANRDVRDYPQRCAEHVGLLLRRERKKIGHSKFLEEKIEFLENKLSSADKEKSRLKCLESQLRQTRRQLSLVESTEVLSISESEKLEVLNEALRDNEFLKKDAFAMKTTIWSFTILICFLVMFFKGPEVYNKYFSQDVGALSNFVSNGYGSKASASWCEDGLSWRLAEQNVDKHIKISGPIANVVYRKDVSGNPTWIEVGGEYPERRRLDLIIWGRNRYKFESVLSKPMKGKAVCAAGQVSEYKGVPQIELVEPGQIRISDNFPN